MVLYVRPEPRRVLHTTSKSLSFFVRRFTSERVGKQQLTLEHAFGYCTLTGIQIFLVYIEAGKWPSEEEEVKWKAASRPWGF